MMNLWQAAWVIARRDFSATVYSRSFIFFLITPLVVIGFSILTAIVGAKSAASDGPVVAITADSATVEAITAARNHVADLTHQRTFPALKVEQPAEDLNAQARLLIADDAKGYSAVFSGTLDHPVLSGPQRIDENVGDQMRLVVEQAQRDRALAGNAAYHPAALARDVTTEAAGNVKDTRKNVARFGQFIIFFFTLLLATMLLSNLIEEKSNKVLEVLAASVPLDSVFFGKLIAMLGVSLIGIALWAGMFGLAALFSAQLLPAGVELPTITPAVGWPVFVLLLVTYYTTSYALLGTLFMGIGGQANSVREMQSLNMPITFLQLGVFVLAQTVIGAASGTFPMIARIFPFSSPLAMIADAAQSDALWPHLLAIPWQLLWVFLTIRVSVALFRSRVMKSGGSQPILPRFGRRKRAV